MADRDRVSGSDYWARVVAGRRVEPGLAVAWIIAAAPLYAIAGSFAAHAAGRLALFDMGTSVYRTAQWASTTALASFIFVAGSAATWFVARALRAMVGLPPRRLRAWSEVLMPLRVAGAIVVLAWLALWATDEVLVRRIDYAPLTSLLLGLLACANFTWEVPLIVRDALSALRARLPLLAMPVTPIGALPSTGRVRVRGSLHPAEDSRLPLRDASGQALVDVAAGPTFVEDVNEGERPAAEHVEVIGEIASGGGDAYRGGVPVIAAGAEPLLVLTQGNAAHRRLTVAAVVELFCAGALALCTLGLPIVWIALRVIAHPGVYKLH